MTDVFSWWSWRPGIAPIRALLVGLPLLLLACVFLATGIYELFSILIADVSPPTHQSGAAAILAILIGLVLLPYPFFLTFGGWHDLRGQKQTITGNIIALRSTATDILRQGRPARPGISSRGGRAWYGMALQPFEMHEPYEQKQATEVVVFRLTDDLYRNLREGITVQVE